MERGERRDDDRDRAELAGADPGAEDQREYGDVEHGDAARRDGDPRHTTGNSATSRIGHPRSGRRTDAIHHGSTRPAMARDHGGHPALEPPPDAGGLEGVAVVVSD